MRARAFESRLAHPVVRSAVLASTALAIAATRVASQEPASPAPIAPTTASRGAQTGATWGHLVSVHVASVSIEQAIDAIAHQAKLKVSYSRDVVPTGQIVSLDLDDVPAVEALRAALRGTSVIATVVGPRSVVLTARNGSETDLPGAAQPGGGVVTGRVIDAGTHVPLDQVSIRVEGPGLGATSTSDGQYTIRNITPGTYHVTARRVGYTALTHAATIGVDAVVTVDFALGATPTKLNEVVTTAVGDQRRYEVGNTIATINADSIAPTAPITSLTDLMSARAPGVVVEETGGLTGSGEAIRIRGQSSLVLQGDPIVIVDGVRQDNTPGGSAAIPIVGFYTSTVPAPSRLNDLDFADIASVDVLKGPAASTEYGTDAANGVIVITTKHGTAGRPQWQASAEQTASDIPERFPTLYYSWGHTTDVSHTPVQCPLVPYAFGSGFGSSAGTCAVDSVTTWDPLNDPHYSIFGTGHRRKYDLSVTGGSDAVRYFLSGGLSSETGVLQMPDAFVPAANALGVPHSVFRPNADDQRSLRTNTAIQLGQTADLTVTGAYLSTYQQTPQAQQLYYGIFNTRPVRDSATAYGYGALSFYSPIYQFGALSATNTSRLTGGLTANWRPVPWFVGHSTVGVDHGSARNQGSVLPQVASLAACCYFVSAQLGIENATTDIYSVDLRGSATASLSHAVRAVTSIGLQLADTRMQGTTVIATGLTSTNFTLNGAVNPTVTQLGNRQATLGGYGEEQLGLFDRLFLTAALRVDAGSGFGNAYNTAAYPKASVSWLVLNASPTTVRLRGAFGESGVQPPNGAALQLYAPSTVWQNGGLGSAIQIANVQDQRLQPERSQEYEGGVDLGLWQNRVSVELTGYAKTTHNALVSVGTGWEAGNYSYTENIGQVRNSGVEGSLTASVVQAHALTWDIILNASLNHNKLVTLAPGVLSQQFMGGSAVYRFIPQYPLYGYWAPRVRYADLNHDGILEANEVNVVDSLSYAGASLPTREASVGTHVGLLGGALSMGALLDYRGGFRLMNTSAISQAVFSPQSDRASNQARAPLWQQARDVGAETILTTGLVGYVFPAGFAEDASYMRFRELSLTYALPYGVVHALRLRNVSLTGAIRNLALWTRYTGTDPEVANSLGNDARLTPTSNTFTVNHDMREDAAAVPLPRYWVVRLNAGL